MANENKQYLTAVLQTVLNSVTTMCEQVRCFIIWIVAAGS